MKEAIGGISLFQIVIVFVLLFTGYICLSLNHTKAYNIKNELVNIIKNNGGICSSGDLSGEAGRICDNFTDQIREYFTEGGYHNKGKCSGNEYGFDREGKPVNDGENAAFCVEGISLNSSSGLPKSVYYRVKVFYQLDLPILNGVFNLTVSGETGRVYEPSECKTNVGYPWC